MDKLKHRELYDYIGDGNLEAVKKLYETFTFSSDLNSAVINGAAIYGRNSIINYLLSKNKNLVINEIYILNSVSAGHLETFKILTKHNELNNKHFNYFKALVNACTKGREIFVEYIINNKLTDIHQNNDEALCKACEKGNLNIVKLLVKQGAHIHANSFKPYVNAIENNRFEVADYLLSLKAKTKVYYEEV